MKNATSSKTPRWQTALLILALLSAAFGAGYWFDKEVKAQQRFDAALEAYLESHGCVVAHHSGRHVESYRCEKPTAGRYVKATKLYQEVESQLKGR